MTIRRDSLPVIDLSQPESWADPRSTLVGALETSSTGVGLDGAVWVLNHSGVGEVLFSRAFEAPNLASRHGDQDPVILDWAGRLMGSMNGEQHRRTRGLVQKAFTPRMVDELRPRMREILDELFARAHTEDTIKPLGELPGRIMMHLIGVPAEDYDRFIDWADDLGQFFNVDLANPAITARVRNAINGLDGYLRDLLENRERAAGPDLLGALAAPREEGQLSTDEVVVLTTNLLSAGTDTVRSSIEIFCWLLATHPDQLALLREQPDLVPNAVEELMRYEPAVPMQVRVAAHDSQIAGLPVRQGEKIVLSLISADRDPEVWDRPNRLDVSRTDDSRPHIFGGGPHACLGAALAGAELQEFLTMLVKRGDDLVVRAPGFFEPYQILRRLEGLDITVRKP